MIVAEVERGIAAPTGAPPDIARIVSQISSDSVEAPRNLTSEMMSKLESVASRHGGRVPLHGRLFAQWMHHAFPNECPYPHVSGSTAPKKPDDWMAERQADPMATKDERSQHTEGAARSHPIGEDGEPLLQWDAEEELLVSPGSDREAGDVSWGKQVARVVLLVGVLASAAQTIRSAMSPTGRHKVARGSLLPLGPEKFSV